MEGFVAHKLNDYANGKISRRSLIEALTLAATTVYAGSAKAADAPGVAQEVVRGRREEHHPAHAPSGDVGVADGERLHGHAPHRVADEGYRLRIAAIIADGLIGYAAPHQVGIDA